MSKIKPLINRTIYYSGLVFILREIYFKLFGYQTRFLCFHRVVDNSNYYYSFLRILGRLNVEEFEKRIKYLMRFYKVVSLDEYYNKIQKCEKIKRTLVLTFDDGYKCFYKNVFPLLKKYRIPASIFLTTKFIDNNEDMFWYDKLIFLIATTKEKYFYCPEILNKQYKLLNYKDKKELYFGLNSFLKGLDDDVKNEMVKKLFQILKVEEIELKEKEQMLTWAQIQEMYNSGLVTYGAHTVSHPILTRIPLKAVENELRSSKERIELELNCKIKSFVYPNGSKNDFDLEIKELVKKTGYAIAFTTINNFNTKHDFYEMPRYDIIREPFFMFGLKISGVFDLVDWLKNKKNKDNLTDLPMAEDKRGFNG